MKRCKAPDALYCLQLALKRLETPLFLRDCAKLSAVGQLSFLVGDWAPARLHESHARWVPAARSARRPCRSLKNSPISSGRCGPNEEAEIQFLRFTSSTSPQ